MLTCLNANCIKRLLAVLFCATALSAETNPKRIVSTSPSITETLFALGLGDRVVGVTIYCRYPEAAKRLPKIGTFIDPNVEVILSLRPDLVVVQQNPVRLTERLRAVGLHVIEVNPISMDGMRESIRTIAVAGGVAERGEALARRLGGDLSALREKTRRVAPLRVLFVVGRTPATLQGIIAVARDSYLAELLEVAGGKNIFADAPSAYPTVTLEEILARDPEVILDMGDTTHLGAMSEEHRQAVVRLWHRYPALAAVKNNRVIPVADDRLAVPGPRIVEAARMFARLLHPELEW